MGPDRYSRPHWVKVEHFSTCRTCGDKNLAWQQSRHGNWYLCQARERDGVIEANRPDWHCCPGPKRRKDTGARSKREEARFMVEIVAAGYRALAMKLHPDHGGSNADMQYLNAAVERLRAELARLSS